MRAVTANAIVQHDHTITLQLPADVVPGPQTVVVVLEDYLTPRSKRAALKFNPYPVGPSDPACTYRREDIYGDDDR